MAIETAGTISAAHLKVILPGLKTHVSKDPFRAVLDHVHVYEEQSDKGLQVIFEASDGHRCIKYKVPSVKGAGHSQQKVSFFFTVGELDLALKTAKLRKEEEVTLANDSASKFAFPDISRVIPRLAKTTREVTGAQGFNASYMADAFDACAHVAKLHSKASPLTLLMPGEDVGPCLLEATGDDVTVLVVVMRIRTE